MLVGQMRIFPWHMLCVCVAHMRQILLGCWEGGGRKEVPLYLLPGNLALFFPHRINIFPGVGSLSLWVGKFPTTGMAHNSESQFGTRVWIWMLMLGACRCSDYVPRSRSTSKTAGV
jgi:hypothetical protein